MNTIMVGPLTPEKMRDAMLSVFKKKPDRHAAQIEITEETLLSNFQNAEIHSCFFGMWYKTKKSKLEICLLYLETMGILVYAGSEIITCFMINPQYKKHSQAWQSILESVLENASE